MSNRLLTVGRIVRYVHDEGEHGGMGRVEAPAVVVRLSNAVADDGGVSLSVFGPYGYYPVPHARYDEKTRAQGTWHWPSNRNKGWKVQGEPPYEFVDEPPSGRVPVADAER